MRFADARGHSSSAWEVATAAEGDGCTFRHGGEENVRPRMTGRAHWNCNGWR